MRSLFLLHLKQWRRQRLQHHNLRAGSGSNLMDILYLRLQKTFSKLGAKSIPNLPTRPANHQYDWGMLRTLEPETSQGLTPVAQREALWELSGPQITHRKEHKCYSKVLTSHPAHKMGNRWIRFLQQYTNIFHLRAYNLPVEVVCSLCIQSGLLLLSRWERPNSTKDPGLETKPSVSKYLAKDAILCPKHEIRGRLWSESPM